MELGSRHVPEFLAALVADHRSSLACLKLGYLGLGGSLIVIFVLRGLFLLNIFDGFVLSLLQPLKGSLDWSQTVSWARVREGLATYVLRTS